MPLTPTFSITQDEAFVRVKIRVPYVRVSGAEMICDGHDFSFYCHPYLLKLTFPRELDGDDEERCKAVYNPDEDNGTIVAHLPKKTSGEDFPDLDLTTLLLQRRKERDFGSTSGIPSIEVLGSLSSAAQNGEDGDEKEEEEAVGAELNLLRQGRPRYGFQRKYTQLFQSFREELVEMLELPEPDKTQASKRREQRRVAEEAKFSPDRYLSDYFEAESDPMYQEAMSFEPFWSVEWKSRPRGVGAAEAEVSQTVFSPAEAEALAALPNREYLVARGSEAERRELLSVADVLYALCFETRCTAGDLTVESAHNVTRLSALLSWLDDYCEPEDCAMTVITNACRRSLVYPYLRSWKLCRKVLADVAKVLFLGKRCVLRCLLQARSLFEHTDSHYMLNKLFLDDMCVWIQSVAPEAIRQLAEQFNQAKGLLESAEHKGKGLVDLGLPEIEAWALSLDADEESEEDDEEDGGGGIGREVPLHLYPLSVRLAREAPLPAPPAPPVPLSTIPTPPPPATTAAAPAAAAVGAEAAMVDDETVEAGQEPETEGEQKPETETETIVGQEEDPELAAKLSVLNLLGGGKNGSSSSGGDARKVKIEVLSSSSFE